MKLLVTGGAGFIGSNFIIHLLGKYPRLKITNLDKLTYAGNLDNLKDIVKNKNYRFVKGDICDTKIVNKLVKESDALVHFAAETHVDRSIKNAGSFVRTNVLGTYTLLEAAVKYRVKKFVHISTDEVYGSRLTGHFKEGDPLNPSSPYSASKASSDLLARSYYVTYKLPVVITRSSNNFGPRQYPEKVIPLFITNLLDGKKVPLYSKGLNVRDWIYVEDNCRAIDEVLQKGVAGEIYNIGAGNDVKNIDLTQKILKKMNQSESMIQEVQDRLGHDFRYAIDCRKIYRLGFKPKMNFDKALSETIDWYRKNRSWWTHLKKTF